MDWNRHALIWPNRRASRIVPCRPHRWHVQQMGKGPTLLLLHGAGGATHSWRDLMPALAAHYQVVAVDLPGQGFTRMGSRRRAGLVHSASDIAALAAQEGWAVDAVIGHSAGAALALQLSRALDPAPRAVIGLNAALERFPGPAEWAFPIAAKLLSLNPLTAGLVAGTISTTAGVRTLIESTGSRLDENGLALYRAVISDRAHVDGALNMMAQWDLATLEAELPEFDLPVLLLSGARDRAVAPAVSRRAAARMPNATAVTLDGLGHLAHEEAPREVSQLIRDYLQPILSGVSALPAPG